MNFLIGPITKSHIAKGKINGHQQFRGIKANYIGTLKAYWIILKYTISHTKYQKEDKEQCVRNVCIMAEQFIKHMKSNLIFQIGEYQVRLFFYTWENSSGRTKIQARNS